VFGIIAVFANLPSSDYIASWLYDSSDHCVLPLDLRPIAMAATIRDGGNDIRAGALLFAAIEREWHAAIRAAAQDGLAAAAVTQQAVAGSCARSQFALPGTPG